MTLGRATPPLGEWVRRRVQRYDGAGFADGKNFSRGRQVQPLPGEGWRGPRCWGGETTAALTTIGGLAEAGTVGHDCSQVGDDAILFVTNVLNGLSPTAPPTTVVNEGTVVRVALDLRTYRVDSETVIADVLPKRNDPAALVVGTTGVGLGANGSALYVASTEDNRITAVPAPFVLQHPVFGSGFTVFSRRVTECSARPGGGAQR
jgi:hypothetical protein